MKDPLYCRRLDVVEFICNFHPMVSFSDQDVLRIISYPWKDLDELDSTLKSYGYNRSAIEDACGHSDFTNALQRLIDAGMAPEEYNNLNASLFGGLLPLYDVGNDESEGQGFNFVIESSSTSFSCDSRSVSICGGTLVAVQEKNYRITRKHIYTEEVIGSLDVKAVIGLFALVFGEKALALPEPLLSLQSFGEESRATISLALKQLSETDERGWPFSALRWFQMEDIDNLRILLEGCRKAVILKTRKSPSNNSINAIQSKAGRKKSTFKEAIEFFYDLLLKEGDLEPLRQGNINAFIKRFRGAVKRHAYLEERIKTVAHSGSGWVIKTEELVKTTNQDTETTKKPKSYNHQSVSKALTEIRKNKPLPPEFSTP